MFNSKTNFMKKMRVRAAGERKRKKCKEKTKISRCGGGAAKNAGKQNTDSVCCAIKRKRKSSDRCHVASVAIV
jgi:hypothetical protein